LRHGRKIASGRSPKSVRQGGVGPLPGEEIYGVRPDTSHPVDLRDLTYGEHLIVWAFRAFAKGRECVIVRKEFEHGCGEHATQAFNAMRVFVQQLAIQGRRPIVLAPPGCLTVVPDEQLVLCLFAAAQAGDSDRFAAHFRWLAAGPHDPVLERVVRLIVTALALRGHRLRAFAEAAGLDAESTPSPGTIPMTGPALRLAAS
jgi:hypothetical protein